jgi:hypothetical protein
VLSNLILTGIATPFLHNGVLAAAAQSADAEEEFDVSLFYSTVV